ncbi:MAG: prepilin peptidase [Halodesulfurarchaeum sp.]
MQASAPDLLRLLAVPVLGWAAVRDVRTRRVPNGVWWPLVLLGIGLLVWEGSIRAGAQFGFRLWAVRVALSLGIVVPLSYAFWYVGGFGGADAKAFMVLAVLFPTFPTYHVLDRTLPFVVTDLGVFSLTILTDTVLVGLLFPLALGFRNLVRGEISWVMFLGHRVPAGELERRHGSLLETPEGATGRGLDLDALRMYLRWRGLDLDTLRANPELAHPETLPDEPGSPTDGAVRTDGGSARARTDEWAEFDEDIPDRWGAETFLSDIDSDAYGTSPQTLREGLDVVTRQDAVWVSPGVPFVVPTFAGLVLALTAGDILFWGLSHVGLV